jgi:catalase
MQGFGVHTFRLVNAEDESTFVKFIWKPKLGMQSVVWNEAVKINGADPDFPSPRSVGGDPGRQFPGMGVDGATVRSGVRRQLSTFDVLDATKIIPGGDPRTNSRSVGWCSTGCRTISSPRPSRLHS